MTSAIGEGAAGLGLTCVLLLVFLVVTRARGRAIRRREEAARERAENLIADYLAGGPEPDAPAGARARAMFAAACLDAVIELRGAERERVSELFVRTGLLAEAAAALRGRRGVADRRRAADALALVAHPDGREPLREGLRDRDADVRSASARGLAMLGDLEALRDIERIGAGDTAEVLLTVAAVRPEALERAFAVPHARARAAEVAGALRLLDHAATLRGLLDAEDPELAVAAARALGQIGDIEAVPALVGLVEGSAPVSLRATALRALGEIGDPSATPVLECALLGGCFEPADAAAEALALLGATGRAALERAARSSGIPSEIARAALAR